MRRITLLTTGLGVGGAEAQTVLLATNLKRRGWDISVVSMLPPAAHLEILARARIPVHHLDMRRGIPDPRAIFRLVRLLVEFAPDLLHCHQVHANLLGRITRLFTPIPIVVSTAHSLIEGGFLRGLAYRLTDPLTDLTTNVCRAGTERYTRLGLADKTKTIWVPNGIEMPPERTNRDRSRRLRAELLAHDRFLWLAVGNLRHEKDYPNMLRAAGIVASTGKPFRVAIAGAGSARGDFKRLAAQLSVGEQVTFLGPRGDVAELLGAADGFLMSSATEGLPIALLEAASAGVPAVATNVGGNPEVVVDGVSGYLAPPRDPRQLAAFMIRMMELPAADRRQMGRAGRRHVERSFAIEPVVELWERIYRRLLEGRDRRALLDLRVAGPTESV